MPGGPSWWEPCRGVPRHDGLTEHGIANAHKVLSCRWLCWCLHEFLVVYKSHGATGELRVVELLLEEGADPDLEDEAGQTPLHWAACVGHAAVIAKLMAGHDSSDTAANKRDTQGWTPLHHAANHGARAAVVALLQACLSTWTLPARLSSRSLLVPDARMRVEIRKLVLQNVQPLPHLTPEYSSTLQRMPSTIGCQGDMNCLFPPLATTDMCPHIYGHASMPFMALIGCKSGI